MKLQEEVQGQSKEMSGPWDDWLRGRGAQTVKPLSYQLQGVMLEGAGDPADQ